MKQGILTEHDAFIMGAKETIIEMIGGQENSDKVTDFVLKEADDNQIMSLLLVQEMPNYENDYTLTEDYNSLVESGVIFETEFFTKKNYIMFEQEIGGFVDNADVVIESLLLEYEPTDRVMKLAAKGGEVAQRPGGAGAALGGARGEAAKGLAKLRQTILNALKRVGKGVKGIPGSIWGHAKLAYYKAIELGKSVSAAISRAMSSVMTFIRNAKAGAKAGLGAAKDFGGSKIKGAVKGAVSGAKGADAYKISTNVAKDVAKGQKSAAARAAKVAKVKGAISKTAGKVSDKVSGLALRHGGKMKVVGAAAAAALAAAASYQAYKRYFSAAAKSCAGKSGSEKDACMAMARKKAVLARIASLKASMAQCSKASNPQSCKSAIASKIQSLQAKAA